MRENIRIQNFKCGECANTIRTNLSKIEGVDHVVVDNVTETVTFQYSEYDQLAKARKSLNRMGYPPIHKEHTLGRKMVDMAEFNLRRSS